MIKEVPALTPIPYLIGISIFVYKNRQNFSNKLNKIGPFFTAQIFHALPVMQPQQPRLRPQLPQPQEESVPDLLPGLKVWQRHLMWVRMYLTWHHWPQRLWQLRLRLHLQRQEVCLQLFAGRWYSPPQKIAIKFDLQWVSVVNRLFCTVMVNVIGFFTEKQVCLVR